MLGALLLFVLSAAPPAPAASPPPEAVRRFREGAALQQTGDFEGAARAYRAALTSAPRFAEAHANLGAVLARLGQYDEAVASYARALRLAPRLAAVHLNLGIAHLRAGQFGKAAASFERYLKAEPSSIQARQLLGAALVEADRDTEALPHLEKAVAAGVDDPGVLLSLGIAYTRLGRPEAEQIERRMAETPAARPLYHLLRGLALQDVQKHGEALKELEAAAAAGLDTPRLHLAMGFSLLTLGVNEAAIASLEKAVAAAPSDYQGFYYLAYTYEREGDLARCREHAERARTLEPSSPEVNGLLGKVLLDQGQVADAIGPLEQAIKGSPKDTEKRYLLARAYRQVGRRADAAREFAEVQRLKDASFKDEILVPGARPAPPEN